MKLVSFRIDSKVTWGIIERGHAIDVGAILRHECPDLKAFIEHGNSEAVWSKIEGATRYSLDKISFLPVIPNPEKIFCVGLNYEEHRKETGRAVVSRPTIFARFANSQTGHMTNIIRPRVSTNLDFEGELAIIIGKPGRYIRREQAFDHIAGYACYNDGSVRDWQHHTHQFTPGKNFPNTGSFGPWMVTPDEFTGLEARRITTRLNDEIVQQAAFGEMLFDIPSLVEYCSSFSPLVSGDVIVTGTPGGVGVKRTPPLWMKPGDLVEVEIDGIGVLQNGIADEAEIA